MDLPKIVAKLRMNYYCTMMDFNNVANQLHLLSDENADQRNKKCLKETIDCMERLGYQLPKEFIDFKNES